MISTRRSARLALLSRPAASIDTTSPLVSRSPRVRLSAPIHPTSCQVPQISTSHTSPNSLALIFHRRLFYTLSEVLAYIQDFPVGQDRVYVYDDVLKQVETIFKLGSAFASGLVRAIKKDKSWALASWSESEVDQLLAPLLHYVRADCVRRKRREGALKTINQHWGPEICSFIRS